MVLGAPVISCDNPISLDRDAKRAGEETRKPLPPCVTHRAWPVDVPAPQSPTTQHGLFSVGDSIRAIEIVGTVIDASSASSKSSAELQALLRQLHSLETALRGVTDLQINEGLHAEVIALKQSAAQCQIAVTDFLRKIESYQPQLLSGQNASGSLKSTYKKIKWALCEKKDVVQLQIDLQAHTESIQLLLATIQMKSLALSQKEQQGAQRSLISHIQIGFSNCMGRLSVMKSSLNSIASQAQACLENSRRIININLRVFQVVLEMQNLLRNIPGQVERQQPVFLNDALGFHTPFHLEFIKSAEALISVLSINFKSVGASRKIQNGDFTIQDTWTKRDIDLSRPFEECFRPGQHVEMSMIFNHLYSHVRSCPRCHHEDYLDTEKDVVW